MNRFNDAYKFMTQDTLKIHISTNDFQVGVANTNL